MYINVDCGWGSCMRRIFNLGWLWHVNLDAWLQERRPGRVVVVLGAEIGAWCLWCAFLIASQIGKEDSYKDIQPNLSCTTDGLHSGGCQLGIRGEAEDTLSSYELLQEGWISGQMFVNERLRKKIESYFYNPPTVSLALERSIQMEVLFCCGLSDHKPGMDELAPALESCDCLTWRRISTISWDGEATQHKT